MKNLLLIPAFISFAILIGFGNNSDSVNTPKNTLEDSALICVSEYASAYHGSVCDGLAKCTHEIRKVSMDMAVKKHYVPCKICYSPYKRY